MTVPEEERLQALLTEKYRAQDEHALGSACNSKVPHPVVPANDQAAIDAMWLVSCGYGRSPH